MTMMWKVDKAEGSAGSSPDDSDWLPCGRFLGESEQKCWVPNLPPKSGDFLQKARAAEQAASTAGQDLYGFFHGGGSGPGPGKTGASSGSRMKPVLPWAYVTGMGRGFASSSGGTNMVNSVYGGAAEPEGKDEAITAFETEVSRRAASAEKTCVCNFPGPLGAKVENWSEEEATKWMDNCKCS